MLRGGVVTQSDYGGNEHRVAGCPVGQLHIRESGVGNGSHRAVQSTNPRRAKPDPLDGSHVLAIGTEVAYIHGSVRVQDDPANHILERRAHRQCHGQTADTQPCEQRHYIGAQPLHTHHEDVHTNDKAHRACAQPKQALVEAFRRDQSEGNDCFPDRDAQTEGRACYEQEHDAGTNHHYGRDHRAGDVQI